MKFDGGTKAAVDLLARLEEQGNLISLSPQLLILRIDHCSKSLHSELCAIYPLLGQVLNDRLHQPHFLVFNLELKKILCFGLGRKFRLFAINAQSNSKVCFYGLNGSGCNKDINEFLKKDPRFQVHKLITGLVNLGRALDDFTALPIVDIEEADVLIDETSDLDDSFIVDFDGVCMTRSALVKIVEQHSLNDKRVANAMAEIRFFFPNAEAVDFNAEDY